MDSSSRNDSGRPADDPLSALGVTLATLGHFGRMGPAPGTVGSILAVALAPLLFLSFGWAGRLVVLAVLFMVGAWAAGKAEAHFGAKDPGAVIIDEVLGQWLTLAPFAVLDIWRLIAGLALFRLFDILKPWPVRASERWLPGGFGVMLDDALAGVYAAAALALVNNAVAWPCWG
jgi:phosphatidylglycerophosphatase A